MNILLLEDDIPLNTTITNFLKTLDYCVYSFFDGLETIKKLENMAFDLYIIDINIPNINGLDIIKYLRQKDIDSPIVMITASVELENFKIAFENGCSEYIRKPFFLDELKIRINNLLDKKDEIIHITKKTSYNLKHRELIINNIRIYLRKKEDRLLYILLKSKNHTVSINNLESYIWENEIKETYPLRQLVNELRKKLSRKKQLIVSDIGIGYRFESE